MWPKIFTVYLKLSPCRLGESVPLPADCHVPPSLRVWATRHQFHNRNVNQTVVPFVLFARSRRPARRPSRPARRSVFRQRPRWRPGTERGPPPSQRAPGRRPAAAPEGEPAARRSRTATSASIRPRPALRAPADSRRGFDPTGRPHLVPSAMPARQKRFGPDGLSTRRAVRPEKRTRCGQDRRAGIVPREPEHARVFSTARPQRPSRPPVRLLELPHRGGENEAVTRHLVRVSCLLS